MINLNRRFGVASSACCRRLKLCDLTTGTSSVETGFTLTVVNRSRLGVSWSVCPKIVAIDWRRTLWLWWYSRSHRLARSCCGCTQRSRDFDWIRIQRVIGALDAISGRQEGVEPLDEVRITTE